MRNVTGHIGNANTVTKLAIDQLRTIDARRFGESLGGCHVAGERTDQDVPGKMRRRRRVRLETARSPERVANRRQCSLGCSASVFPSRSAVGICSGPCQTCRLSHELIGVFGDDSLFVRGNHLNGNSTAGDFDVPFAADECFVALGVQFDTERLETLADSLPHRRRILTDAAGEDERIDGAQDRQVVRRRIS